MAIARRWDGEVTSTHQKTSVFHTSADVRGHTASQHRHNGLFHLKLWVAKFSVLFLHLGSPVLQVCELGGCFVTQHLTHTFDSVLLSSIVAAICPSLC